MSSLKIGGMGDHLGVNVCAVLDSAECCPGQRGVTIGYLRLVFFLFQG